MKTIYLTVIILALCVLGIAPVADALNNNQGFAENASIGNQFEISSSELALQNSQNTSVRNLAQKMIDDHTQLAKDMQNATADPDATDEPLPAVMLDHKHQKMVDSLGKKTGANFDKEYIADQINAHKEAIKLFQDYAKNGDDPSLKDFAASHMPLLKQHQAEVMSVHQSL